MLRLSPLGDGSVRKKERFEKSVQLVFMGGGTRKGKKQKGCLVIWEFQISKGSFYFNIWDILILKR